jgi:hypothetical protein
MAVVSVVILVLVLFFGRYILAFLAIITGDKTVLHEAGNFLVYGNIFLLLM